MGNNEALRMSSAMGSADGQASPVTPPVFAEGSRILTPREALVERWRERPARIKHYQAGVLDNGTPYPEGDRLFVNGEQVMDTAETPWCRATVDAVFRGKERSMPPLVVLDRGFGLGITANLIMQKLVGIGTGEYHVVELNRELAERAKRWEEQMKNALNRLSGKLVGTRPDVKIKVHEEDAYALSKRFKQDGKEFDIVISDTYPMGETEKGENDLGDLDDLIDCIADDGRFTFCAQYPGSQGGVSPHQRDILYNYFRGYNVTDVPVVLPPDYPFAQGADGKPVKILP